MTYTTQVKRLANRKTSLGGAQEKMMMAVVCLLMAST